MVRFVYCDRVGPALWMIRICTKSMFFETVVERENQLRPESCGWALFIGEASILECFGMQGCDCFSDDCSGEGKGGVARI